MKTIIYNNKTYHLEKFESFRDACEWCSENRPYVGSVGSNVRIDGSSRRLSEIICYWGLWHKLIEVEPLKTREFWLWDVRDQLKGWSRCNVFVTENGVYPDGTL